MTPFIQHLLNRGLNNNILFDIDYDQEIVSFPLFTPWGKRVGYQNYRWNNDKTKHNNEKYGRYYSHISPSYRHCAFFGTDSLRRQGPLFIVEGVWDAVSVLNCGYACLALLGATPSPEMTHYINEVDIDISSRFRVGILDNDETSAKMKKVVHRSFCTKPFKDINECPRMYIKSFIYRKLALLNVT